MRKRGQIWVETVIYTLIGIAIIGVVLGVAKPKIDEQKDRIAIDQAIDSLGKINSKIIDVQSIPGNRRVINLKIGEGELVVDSGADTISWEMPSSFQYSEEGVTVPIGDIDVTTTQRGGSWLVTMKRGYFMDIRHASSTTEVKRFSAAPTPYTIVIENEGKYLKDVIINIREA